MYILYETTNLVNGKIYVGVHYTEDEDNDPYLGSGLHITRAIKKHGRDNFRRITLERFDCKETAYQRECEYVNREFVERDDTYNLKVGGKGAPAGEDHHMFGKTHSEDVRRKIGESNIGKPSGMIGKNHSEETKKKIGDSSRGRKFSEEHKRRISESQKGKVIPEESKKKMSEAKKGKYCGENHPWYGKTHSEKSKQKMRESQTGKKASEETKAKMRENNSGSTNPNSKYIWVTPKGEYDSAYLAADDFGIDRKTVEQRCRKGRDKKLNKKEGATWDSLGWNVKERL